MKLKADMDEAYAKLSSLKELLKNADERVEDYRIKEFETEKML